MQRFTKAIAAIMLMTATILCISGCKKDNAEGDGVFNGHTYVDLGLPSGTLWAVCNVGANTPEDYGGHFAWGETQTKATYSWNTYKWCNDGGFLTKYCNMIEYGYNGLSDNLTTLLTEDDAATAKWGNGWRMPTYEQWQELHDNTTSTWIALNGVNGRLFTASNGHSIFLPAAGYRNRSSLYDADTCGYYWSRSLYASDPSDAWYFYFGSDYTDVDSYYRRSGRTVRPVCSAAKN